jgi:signal transduction histidine kinase
MTKTVLRNLVTNALKFTFPEGTIKIECEKHENEMVFGITDTGIGIEPEHINKLFRIESKLSKNGTADEKGTGLGLILCKEFVEKQQGRIWVESETGKGSCFSFTIPLFTDGNSTS